MSSGVVSKRTRTTFSPFSPRSAASSAENTTVPTAAPGEAGRPVASAVTVLFGSMVGCSSWSSWAGSIRCSASSLVISPSATMSEAVLIAAAAVRFPVRVCSMNSSPFSMVNSMSCMSR